MSNQIVKTILTGALSLGMVIPTGAAGLKVLASKMTETPEVPVVTTPTPSLTPIATETNPPTNEEEISSSIIIEAEPQLPESIVVPVAEVLPTASILPSATPTPKASTFPAASVKPAARNEIEIEDEHEDEVRFEKHRDNEDEYDD